MTFAPSAKFPTAKARALGLAAIGWMLVGVFGAIFILLIFLYGFYPDLSYALSASSAPSFLLPGLVLLMLIAIPVVTVCMTTAFVRAHESDRITAHYRYRHREGYR